MDVNYSFLSLRDYALAFTQFIENLHQSVDWQNDFKSQLNKFYELSDCNVIFRLIELFQIDSQSVDSEEIEELAQIIWQTCESGNEQYVEIINDVSIAISELLYLRHSIKKPKNQIDIKRFCSELIERGLVIHPVVPLIAALQYVYKAIQVNAFSYVKSFRIGELVQTARLAQMCWQVIDSNASQYNPTVKDVNIPQQYQELEPAIRKQVHIILTDAPHAKQLSAKVKKWLQNETNNKFIMDDAPDKWFKRIVSEEKYFFEAIKHFPIWR
ncbi:hypothetical protein NQU96_12550 [Pseudoalteromonas elyakovii]|nr:hypothetical protein [Pseudoalteromonas elyakovii]